MVMYHGTTKQRARRICVDGFLPKQPSRRVWFTDSWNYAYGRAKTWARRTRDRPVVLTCQVDLGQLRSRLGPGRVLVRNGIVAVDGRVPVSVLRSYPAAADQPTSPGELASWVNRLLRLKPGKGVAHSHPGIHKLSRWLVQRLTTRQRERVSPRELLGMARHWLPEFFEEVAVDPRTLHASRKVETVELRVESSEAEGGVAAGEAVVCLMSEAPRRRVRGLSLMAEGEDPDLFEWAAMFLQDPSADVRVAALRTICRCEEGDPEVIVPSTESEDKRIRAAAFAAVIRHAGREAPLWFEYGLKDPEPCVRIETARQLAQLVAEEHPKLFELALYDTNPAVSRIARKLTEGKGFGELTW